MDTDGGHHYLDNVESLQLPPGFRFHPTDEELITCYLLKKVVGADSTGRAITAIDLNKCEPWELPEVAKMGEEWYFLSLRDRKYPTGLRTNRATGAGYWKATGKDKEVHSTRSGALVGMKKTLVFYTGRAPKGAKSSWVMHEYRLEGAFAHHLLSRSSKDEWVLARVFHKSSGGCKKTRHFCPSVTSTLPVAFSVESKDQTGVCGSPPSASLPHVLDSSAAPFAVVTGSQAAETIPDSILFFRRRSAEKELVPCFSSAANHASRTEELPACDGSGSGFPFLRPLPQESVHLPYSLMGTYQVPTPLRVAPTVDGVLLSSGELRGRRVGDAWPWGAQDSKAYGQFKQHVGSSELDRLWTV